MRIRFVVSSLIALVVVAPSLGETPLSTAFTYQGQLKQGGAPASGNFDMEFRLFDAATLGNQIGNPVPLNGVAVVNGLFTVALNAAGDFGPSAFNGDDRWLEVHVNGTPLASRQPITATPYAVTALSTVGVDGHSLDAADGDPSDALLVDNAGKVGIGTNTPFGKLDVRDEGLSIAHLGGTSTLGA